MLVCTRSVHHASHGLSATRTGVDIDAINYTTKYMTKMKAKFSYCDQIKFNVPVLKPGVGGAVASWLVRSSLDREVRVRALAGDIVLCSQARHFTLTVPLYPDA